MYKAFSVALFCCSTAINAQAMFPYKFTRTSNHQDGCDVKVNVVDSRPSSCTFANGQIMYPVLVENFNYKEDLPNNFGFNMNYTLDNNYKLTQTLHYIWSGSDLEAYNHNVSVISGTCYLTLKKESTPILGVPYGSTSYSYDLTFSDLRTLYKIKQGYYLCKMKLPENIYLWPAFWLRGATAEIDIFEFYDGDVTSHHNCDVYHSMRMTAADDYGNSRCSAGRKFPVASNFFNYPHLYQLTWTDYKYEISLDNTFMAYGTKYYDGPFHIESSCYTGGGPPRVPNKSYYCSDMQDLQGCNVTSPFNSDVCWVYNKVYRNRGFVSSPMELFISTSIFSPINYTKLMQDWNNILDIDKRIEVDQLVIYQPISCTAIQYVNTIQDFKNLTSNTNFLSGSQINIGGALFASYPPAGVSSHAENYQFLAIDEIAFTHEVEVNDGTYMRAEIIECSGTQILQKTPNGSPLPTIVETNEDEIKEIERREADSLAKVDPLFAEELELYNKSKLEWKSAIDNGAINLFPNPTNNSIFIDMSEEDFNDIVSIEVIDFLGRKMVMEKTSTIAVEKLSPGLYQLKFVFSFGHIVVKSFVKN